MTTLLPKDADNNAIPALRMRDNGAHQITVSSTANRNVAAFDDDTKVISLYATGPVYIAFGDDTVTATSSDHYFPGNIYYDVAVSGGSGKGAQNLYVSALAAETDCDLYISEKE